MHGAVRVADAQLRGVRAVHIVLHAIRTVRRQALVCVWHLLRHRQEPPQQQILQHVFGILQVSSSPLILRQCTQLSRWKQLSAQDM